MKILRVVKYGHNTKEKFNSSDYLGTDILWKRRDLLHPLMYNFEKWPNLRTESTEWFSKNVWQFLLFHYFAAGKYQRKNHAEKFFLDKLAASTCILTRKRLPYGSILVKTPSFLNQLFHNHLQPPPCNCFSF